MKNLTIKTIFTIIFLSLFITSCTDLESDNDDLLIDNIENTQLTDDGKVPECEGKDC